MAPVFITLASLTSGTSGSGTFPDGGVVLDASGDLFGTASAGGANGVGTVFELANSSSGYASTPSAIVSFNGSNGSSPSAGLITDSAGDLFGTTASGGFFSNGSVFELTKTQSGYSSNPTTLVSFNGGNGNDPAGSLIADANGDLFGTTQAGGANSDGTVFEIVKTGNSYATTPTTLVSFSSTNGTSPNASLVADSAGDLFGATANGGVNGEGSVFEIAKAATSTGYSSTPTTVISFNGTNGSSPNGSLITDAAGDLFGTTTNGGEFSNGTVFEIVKTASGYASTPTTLISFNGTDGTGPSASLIADANGNLFGTTFAGGANNDGTVFEIAKTSTGYANSPTTLFNFNSSNANPDAQLVADANGDLFGATNHGGQSGAGTLFEITGSGYAVTQTQVNQPQGGQAVHSNDLTYSSTASGSNHFIDLPNFEASFGDLISAFGSNQQAMQNWYTTREPIENRVETFDGLDYVASYSDLIGAFRGAGSLSAVQDAGANHYISYGSTEGRTTSFNGLDYIASYSDLIHAFGANNDAGAYHYIEYGSSEGRTTTFDGLDYIASYTDLISAYGANEQAGAAHYISYGSNEGRTTSFDGLAYIAQYTDLMNAFGANNDAGATHYIDYGFSEGRGAAFNVAAYESAHPDLIGKYSTNDQFLTAYINTYKTTGQFLT